MLPNITLKDFFLEVAARHLDASIPKSMDEYNKDADLQDEVIRIIQDSRQASQAILVSCAKTGINPPVIATCMQMGIIIGVGLALELLNEKENGPDPEAPPEDFDGGHETIQ
jgi:hypothetical protein